MPKASLYRAESVALRRKPEGRVRDLDRLAQAASSNEGTGAHRSQFLTMPSATIEPSRFDSIPDTVEAFRRLLRCIAPPSGDI